MTVMRQDIEERPHKIETLTSNIGYLEDWTYPLADELCRCVHRLHSVFNEDWYLSCPLRLENADKLRNSLLQNLRWANIDLGDDHHDGHIQRKCNAQMFSA